MIDPTKTPIVLGTDGKIEIVKPPAVVEAERQQLLAKQRMHRQVALEMYRSELESGRLRPENLSEGQEMADSTQLRKALIDQCIDLAAYLIEKTGGHQ